MTDSTNRANGSDTDGAPTVAELQHRLAAFAAARNWGPYHTPKNLATALVVEAGELAEIFQWLTPEQSLAVMSDPEAAGRVRDEVADVLSYLLQFAMACGVDPLIALAEKIERNDVISARLTRSSCVRTG